jgi:response regulator RpfG family c-di-GMP phosphodiesterase
MSSRVLPRILCVDDEQRVVEGLALSLRKDFQVLTALSGAEGLKLLRETANVAVVVSDMRMPGMDGAAFLQQVMKVAPTAARILLTGEPGRDVAVSAVNRGQIFRFLTKPCAPEALKTAVDDGVAQYRLANAERSIMQETLLGCIAALIDVLAITNPVAHGRATRAKRIAMGFADSLSMPGYWQLEAAVMLSQLGYLSLPVNLVEKVYYGEPLLEEEQILVSGAPEVAIQLLGHIPRLEPVLQILLALNYTDEQLARLGDGTIGLGARILGLVLEYDSMLMQGNASDVAVQTLRRRGSRYGEELIESFAKHVGAGPATGELRQMPLRAVKVGMTILQDVRTQMGTLLVPRGFIVTEVFLDRILRFGPDLLGETVKVHVPAAPAAPAVRQPA